MQISIQFVTFLYNSAFRDCNLSHSQLGQAAFFPSSITLFSTATLFIRQSCFCLVRLCSSATKDTIFALIHIVDGVSVILVWCTLCSQLRLCLFFIQDCMSL